MLVLSLKIRLSFVLAGTMLLLTTGSGFAQYRCLIDDGTDGGATSSGPNSLACGSQASANPPDPASPTFGFATAVGTLAKAEGDISTAVGTFATANGLGSSAFGASSKATGRLSTATGAYAEATSSQSTATGYHAIASGPAATATGQSAQATSLYATATGSASKALGYGSTATGYDSQAKGSTGEGGATATGMSSKALGDYSVSNGYSASAYGDNNTAVGAQAVTGGTSSNGFQNRANTALGSGASAGISADGQVNSTAVGAGAAANASNALALGSGAKANLDNSIAIGQGIVTDRTNQVKLGSATNTYTLSGVASDASRAEQVGVTHLVTTDGAGNLATSTFDIAALNDLPDNIAALDGRVGALESGFQNLGGEISETRTEARAGTALALATAGLRYDDRPGKMSLAGGFGHFKGQSGLALGLGYNTSEEFRMNAAVSATTGRGDVGVSVGASWTLN